MRTGGGFELELTNRDRAQTITAGTGRLRIERLEIACPDAGTAAETLDATLDPEVRARIDVHPLQQRFAELAGWRLEPAI